MKELIKQVAVVSELVREKKGIISVDYNLSTETMEVLVRSDYFTELVDELDIKFNQVEVAEREDDTLPLEVYTEIDGVYILSAMTQKDFDDFIQDWLYPPVTDEEFITSPLTSQERAMREAGHKLSDFA